MQLIVIFVPAHIVLKLLGVGMKVSNISLYLERDGLF